jgi:hypothetical protein
MPRQNGSPSSMIMNVLCGISVSNVQFGSVLSCHTAVIATPFFVISAKYGQSSSEHLFVGSPSRVTANVVPL